MKKVLAWAVVLALVLSSFTMAFAGQTKTSKDFKDASEINYTEAVDVMVATGVINGYPDGTFGPAKTVKRAEMAKMIAVMMNGGEDIGDQYKSACPFKDSKSHWAAGYIAYCASEHIIDGRSADVFDPEAEVTGTEVAKMALTSLGYDSKIQGYTGETWAAAVLKDAKKVGLFEGLDKSFVPGDPCNRESAAQILFNALQAQEVEYPASINVNTGDAEVNVSTGLYYGDQLYKDVFGKNSDATLEKKTGEAAKDDFGRPGHSWKCEGDDVGTYSDPVDYEFTVEDATSVAKAIEAYDKELAKTLAPNKYSFAPTLINGQASEAIALGDKVELYVTEPAEGTDAPGKVDVIVVQYKPAQITKVDTKKISKEEAEKGITAKLTLDTDAAVKAADNTMAGYDESTYVVDAVIAVAVGQKDGEAAILDSYVPEELVAGTITKVKGSTYTIDGKDCTPTGSFKAFGGELAVKGDYTVYDYSGYMFASVKEKAAAAEVFYGVITANKAKKLPPEQPEAGTWSDAEQSAEAAMVKVLTPEGKTETLSLAEDVNLPAVESLVAYELNEDGDISKITIASDPLGDGKDGVKTGNVLYGKQLTEEVAAFALIPPATDKDKAEWKVYTLKDLEAAEAIDVKAYFEEEAGIVVMKVESLEAAVKSEEVMAIVTKVEPVTNENGDAYEITAFVEGKEETFTTRALEENDPLTALYAEFNQEKIALAMLTFKDDLVDSIRAAKCQSVNNASAKVEDGIDAVFYMKEGESIYAREGIRPVISVSGSLLNVGTAEYIDNQSCAGADVYSVAVEGVEANATVIVEKSDLESIEEGNLVLLMKLKADSSTWDTVFFMELTQQPT